MHFFLLFHPYVTYLTDLDKHACTHFTRRVRAQGGSGGGLRQEQHPWGRQEVSVKDSLAGLKQTGFSTRGGVQQNMKQVVREDRYRTGMRALLCTFSLQLSSTSVLIRPSQLSLNHAGSLQHKQKHREEQQFNTEINKGNMDCL